MVEYSRIAKVMLALDEHTRPDHYMCFHDIIKQVIQVLCIAL
jgi:hypothetical protein